MPDNQPIFPFGFPAKDRLELLTGSFSQAYPVEETRGFEDLLTAIDEAHDELGRARGKSPVSA